MHYNSNYIKTLCEIVCTENVVKVKIKMFFYNDTKLFALVKLLESQNHIVTSKAKVG